MKKVFYVLHLLCVFTLVLSCKKNDNPVSPSVPGSDSFQVVVNNGYGSGKYKVGDTVHIFSKAYTSSQVFGAWSGSDAALLNASDEWHTWFIMPGKNVTITGSIQNIQPFTLQYEKISGRDTLKPVYYYFPVNYKGIVYLLHGTSGSAANLIAGYEWQLMITDLINNNFAVIITEAEESTKQKDLDGDGKIRWHNQPSDTTTNVDYANIRIITDALINRGIADKNKPKYSIGMSDGGYFSASLSTIYNYKSGVSYCAPAGNPIARMTKTPFQFCMARFDNNPNVGPTGNANALANSKTITNNGICSKYFIKERSPLYPERFARRGDITINESTNIFNEIKANGLLDANNYFKGYSEDLQAAYSANQSAFPQIKNLAPLQKAFVLEQVSLAVSDHHMYSDFDRTTIKFLNTQCQ